MSTNQFYDVVVVGAGAFSSFTALLLTQKGMRVALVYPEDTEPVESFLSSLSTCWPSLNDPPTRAEVAHGHEVAAYLHEFCANGLRFFQETLLHLINDQANWIEAKCFRVGLKEFEVQELLDAFVLGFGLKKTDELNIFKEDTSSLVCLDKKLFQKNLIQALKENNVILLPSEVIKLNESQNKCTLQLKNGQTIESEIIVLGNALKIANIMPKFKPILIPMSDCLFEYEMDNINHVKFEPLTFRASNGHICASVFVYNQKIKINLSGPRFLLPGAGAGLDLTKVDLDSKVFQAVQKYHSEIIFELLSKMLSRVIEFEKSAVTLNSSKIIVDCYPCDELPILGEYGKLGRILGNTGWLATGLSSGSWASSIICELIMSEKSSALHSRLHPRRLFSNFVKN